MKKELFKVLALLVAVTLVIGSFAGCTTTDKEVSDDTTKVEDETSTNTEEDKKAEETVESKITDKPVTLTYWCDNPASETTSSLGETPLYQEVERRTGVKIEFLHPTGSANEQFNLMVASRDLPDLIERNWVTGYAGGPEKAISDGVILDHTDIIEKYAVNLKKYLEANPEIDKAVKTDSKKYYIFPFIRGDEYLRVWFGPQIRKDWLDELNLEVPETVDEWEKVLRAFKEQKGVEFPLTIRFSDWKTGDNSFIIGAYGASFGFYNDNGTVKYGRIQPGFKDALVTLRRWYEEGLLDPEFDTQDGQTFETKVTSEKAGAFIGAMGGRMGRFTTIVRQNNPKFLLTATRWPTLKKGEVCRFGHKDPAVRGDGTSISAQCEEVEIAAKWLDFGYSEEGHMLYNFGIEGESYEMINGYPTYTDLILKNPEGLTIDAALKRYVLAATNGPFVQDRRYVEQYAQLPEQKEALAIWSSSLDDSTKLPLLTFTPEESEKISSIMGEINSYVDNMFIQFVKGEVSLDEFDGYVEQVKKMGIEEVIQCYQAALERYNAR